MDGFAVVDTETTGIDPTHRHRIAEVAVVHLDAAGAVTGEWSTLLNPERDLGPQAIHRITAAEARRAPRFADIAGDLVEQVRGRVVVAHNWPFDAMHLRAEFARIGVESPFDDLAGFCTMRAASIVMPNSRRSLVACCTTAGLPAMRWHTARDDAMAAGALFGHMLAQAPEVVRPTDEQLQAAAWGWPALARDLAPTAQRLPADHVEPHFLARLVPWLPRDEEPLVDAYFAVLDDALLDRRISASDADALVGVATRLGLRREEVLAIHHTYLRALAQAAVSVGERELADIGLVATLLGLDGAAVADVLTPGDRVRVDPAPTVGGLVLRPGDKVVFTGMMTADRDDLTARAVAAGLRVMTAVSRQTRLVAAADPDTMSVKAKDARVLGVPVVTEDAFVRALAALAG
ncbi:exonuclease domain-containing protein [Actinokineospora diospyrosa]|uniref:DNA polymerase-3 subunit epsilon n=1 Tax=Actinokineospora diospyrosa TaxID=103728 RepID=A0ABT1I615_9PSEU|nr:exonuclease domain-containing protein [Actinokineospora diospyrosa]MCP2268073.1 DNA polymerase-3 subunit epsilon [Actinokineospora diospyrosa]